MKIYFNLFLFFISFSILGQSHESWPRLLHEKNVSESKSDPLDGVLFLKPSIHYKKSLENVKNNESNQTIESFSISSNNDLNSSKETKTYQSKDILIDQPSLNGWFWHPDLEWIYIDEKSYPYFYLFSKSEWIFIFVK